jgi:hypothetical protein
MIGRLGRVIATAALAPVAFGVSACGGYSSNPLALQPASVQSVSPAAFACLTKPCLYVANFYAPSVTVYQQAANGNVKPLHTIAGSNTGLHGPYGVALDASRNVYVVNTNGGSAFTGSVTVYAAGANGNVAPIQTLIGSNTGLNQPFGVAIKLTTMYVANENGSTVTVYASSANGNIAPGRTISGSNTGLNGPTGITIH